MVVLKVERSSQCSGEEKAKEGCQRRAWWLTHLVEGEAGKVGSLEGGEVVRREGTDSVAAARGQLLADGVDAIGVCLGGDGGQVQESHRCMTDVGAEEDTGEEAAEGNGVTSEATEKVKGSQVQGED